ncbi:hypothetical protein BEL04_09450 [Mucilaginibacter sp. PPCGB 2223]|nr:hypothetical protein BEL04_09450 [Mucilaginibacter sp. PPCGB 2223]
MHPEIETAMKHAFEGYLEPNDLAKINAEKLVNHLSNKGLYQPRMLNTTWTGGFSIFLTQNDWQFHMQANNEGRIVYIIFKGSEQMDCGSLSYDEYMPILVYYLNTIKMAA